MKTFMITLTASLLLSHASVAAGPIQFCQVGSKSNTAAIDFTTGKMAMTQVMNGKTETRFVDMTSVQSVDAQITNRLSGVIGERVTAGKLIFGAAKGLVVLSMMSGNQILAVTDGQNIQNIGSTKDCK